MALGNDLDIAAAYALRCPHLVQARDDVILKGHQEQLFSGWRRTELGVGLERYLNGIAVDILRPLSRTVDLMREEDDLDTPILSRGSALPPVCAKRDDAAQAVKMTIDVYVG